VCCCHKSARYTPYESIADPSAAANASLNVSMQCIKSAFVCGADLVPGGNISFPVIMLSRLSGPERLQQRQKSALQLHGSPCPALRSFRPACRRCPWLWLLRQRACEPVNEAPNLMFIS